MHIGIIGGGMMGLATAHYLNKKGDQVTVLEKESEIGGLSRSVEILPGIQWDRFYQVILSTDTDSRFHSAGKKVAKIALNQGVVSINSGNYHSGL